MRSSHVRTQACSGDWALIRSNRSSSLAIVVFTPSGASRPSSSGAELTDDVVVALAEFLADRVELLAQQPFALLLVDALAHVVTDRLRDLEFGQVVPGPRVDGVDAVGQVDGAEHDQPVGVGELGPGGHGVGERARAAVRAQDLGQAPRAAQFARSVRAWRAARGWRRRSTTWTRCRRAPRPRRRSGRRRGRPCRRSAGDDVIRARCSIWTIAAGSPLGRLPMFGTWAMTPSWCSSPPVSTRRPWRRRRRLVAASTAWRSSSVLRTRVTTAPGSTIEGRWA